MKIIWSTDAWDDYVYWQKNDLQFVKKINELISDIRRSPFVGLGKPEPLKADLSGWWARRISGEHRLVYRVQGKGDDHQVTILMCRHHYLS